MTVVFTNIRIAAYVFIFALSATVLGVASNFAKLFLPHVQHDYTIFSLVVPSVTIFALLLILQFAQPVVEVLVHVVLGILWLTMASWTSDIIGPMQCYILGGISTPTNNGSMSARSYCYQMKVMEAFSWALFISLLGFIVIVICLTSRAIAFGRRYAWTEHISQLGWFGELPGYPTEAGISPSILLSIPVLPVPREEVLTFSKCRVTPCLSSPGANGVPMVSQMPGPVP
ncbi:hypothetical protein EDD16DRAFT_1831305 [Pisolithus croceorrhizus]|nr:hypothetical protein EDD16DRAFT_1831305 [Pisolithus croceorrhizus]